MPPLLQLNNVSRFFGALKAVDGVSITVAAGEALGVIGPNGAGKTTLFNLITGDLPLSRGQLFSTAPISPRCRHMLFRGVVLAAPTKSRILSRP